MRILEKLVCALFPALQEKRAARLNALLARAKGQDSAFGNANARMCAALDLYLDGHFGLAREGFNAILQDRPERRGDVLCQIGECYHMEGHYEAAVKSYREAMALGADRKAMLANIMDARTAMAM